MNARLKAIYTDRKPAVVLGVTGGIAAYKACELLRLLQKEGCDVWVIMTANACRFITPLTFETLSGHPVAVDTFGRSGTWEVEHVALAKRADLFAIVPATANILAKMACGIADDMLSTTALAVRAPILAAPAMNTGMLVNPATQHNLEVLKNRGVRIAESGSGYLACGDEGDGRLADVEIIKEYVLEMLMKEKDLKGVRVAVTAGPTREDLDPVRYISNRSSGKMGYAVARAARQRGAEVTLISGPVCLPVPQGVRFIPAGTTDELLRTLESEAPRQDIVIQAAAPADFRAKEQARSKIKKEQRGGLLLELTENPDVAAAIGRKKRADQVFVGFAAETDSVSEHARKKLVSKNLDLIIANDVTKPGAGFDVDTNIVTIISEDQLIELPIMSKEDVAHRILDEAAGLLKEKKTGA